MEHKLPTLKTHRIVYRVESWDGFGPYRNRDMKYLNDDNEINSSSSTLITFLFGGIVENSRHPGPRQDSDLAKNLRKIGINVDRRERTIEAQLKIEQLYFGFKDITQLKRWFGKRVNFTDFHNDNHKFRISVYMVPRDDENFIAGTYQCMFHRSRAFLVDVISPRRIPKVSVIKSDIELTIGCIKDAITSKSITTDEYENELIMKYGIFHPDHLDSFEPKFRKCKVVYRTRRSMEF